MSKPKGVSKYVRLLVWVVFSYTLPHTRCSNPVGPTLKTPSYRSHPRRDHHPQQEHAQRARLQAGAHRVRQEGGRPQGDAGSERAERAGQVRDDQVRLQTSPCFANPMSSTLLNGIRMRPTLPLLVSTSDLKSAT